MTVEKARFSLVSTNMVVRKEPQPAPGATPLLSVSSVASLPAGEEQHPALLAPPSLLC